MLHNSRQTRRYGAPMIPWEHVRGRLDQGFSQRRGSDGPIGIRAGWPR
jgi:hypothetical protein